MKTITLLPADTYTVVNKSLLNNDDRKNLIALYEPIIGPIAVALYLTLWNDLDKLEITSDDLNHHHLMTLVAVNMDHLSFLVLQRWVLHSAKNSNLLEI
jgi:replication initiation and membrane attachment protein